MPATAKKGRARSRSLTKDDSHASNGFHVEETNSKSALIAPATRTYLEACQSLGALRPDPVVVTALETRHESLCLSLRETGHLLAVMHVFSKNLASHVKEIKLFASNHGTVNDCYTTRDVDVVALCWGLADATHVETLELHNLGIGPKGIKDLAGFLQKNTGLRVFRLTHNPLMRTCHHCHSTDPHGYDALVDALRVRSSKSRDKLELLDLSHNGLGYETVTKLLRASSGSRVHVLREGNHVLEEVLNAGSHFMGLLIALAGTAHLMWHSTSSTRVWWSSLLFCSTLLGMFSFSSLFHASTFVLPRYADYLNVLDHTMIYLLIAGSCSPFLHVSLYRLDPTSYVPAYIAAAQWSMALFGIGYNVYNHDHRRAKYKLVVEFTLFFGQVLVMLLVQDDLVKAIGPDAVWTVKCSALIYAVGSLFFIMEHHVHPVAHALWHLFVCWGAAVHYWAVLHYVV